MPYADASNDRLLGKQAERESSARSYPRHLPMAIREAQGVEVTDADGNTYYDCLAGAGTLHLGHNHPVVIEAIEDAMAADRPMHTLDITTPTKEAFVDTLFDSLPDEFADSAKIQFCSPAGTDAVEAALKLTKTATGNRSVLSFRGGYHGMTHGALGLMGDTGPKEEISGTMGSVHHLPYPYSYRCPFGVGEAGHEVASEYVERLLADPERGFTDPAAMVLEPVQGEGGSIAPPADWLREMRRITREHDVPLVVDEIQSGLGRTGDLYDFERAGITPDVVTLSKAVGGGLPLAVVLYDEELDEWESGAHTGTFRGNQLAMAAGKATIEYIVDEDLPGHAEKMGARLRNHLDAAADRFAEVGDVRGRGLMLGAELVDSAADPDDLGARPPDSDLAEAVQSECFDRGLIVERGGREGATVRFLPPLVVSKAQIEDVGSIFREAVAAAVESERATPGDSV
jgi:diaminobutyrate-2-oxoglutarate transaminase